MITSVGPQKQFPYLKGFGCPPASSASLGCSSCGTASGAAGSYSGPYLVQNNTPLRAVRIQIGGGDRAIKKTIKVMEAAVYGNEGAANPEIRRTAVSVVANVPSRDQAGEIAAVLQWIKQNISFRGEYGETVQTPLVTLQLRAGDCDCHSTLAAALLLALGYQARFRTVAADPTAPQAFSHVLLEVFQRKTGRWTPLDTTVPESYPGWAPDPSRVFRSKSWDTLGRMGDQPALSPNAQAIYNLITPLDQALAARIQYGKQSPAPTANLNLGVNTSSVSAGGVSPMILYGAGALGLVALIAVARGRRS